MNISAHIDFETASKTDLRKSGVFRYAEDPSTRIWGFSWRIGNEGPVSQWRPGYPDPTVLLEHIRMGGMTTAHNAAFERTIWNWVIVGRTHAHWPLLEIKKQDCTMSRAAAIGHPQALDKLGTALDTVFKKDGEGHKLMMKMAKPRRINEDGSITWWDAPEDIDRNMEYCDQDVRTETAADEMLPPLSPRERQVWEFDQVINERGVPFDMPVVERAAQLVEYAKKQNDKVMRDITDRAVPKCSTDKKTIAWLNSRGIKCTSLAKGEIEDVIFLATCALDEVAQEAISLRRAAWKTSTAKYRAMQRCVSHDGRVRGLLNYHGAGPGRWAGRLVQPQNFKRVDPDDKELQGKIGWMHELLNSDRSIRNVYETVVAVFGPLEVLDLLSCMLRSCIKAEEGKKFVSGDFSNVEGRVNAWLAGEAWKLQAFQDYDDRVGPDLYKLAYARSFGVPVETIGKGKERQIGKVQELALGFQGGIGAYIAMGSTYGVNPFELSLPVMQATSAQQWDMTSAKYEKARNKFDLYEKEWTALQILVDNWRAANPAIVQSWWDYQDAAIEAVAAPGTIVYCGGGRVHYYSDGRCLWCILPGGRALCYPSPEVVTELVEYTDKYGETKTRRKRKVVVSHENSMTRQWERRSLYGGLQCENIVQATARDLMVDAMFEVESRGYPVILTVHDELLTEVDEHRDDLNAAQFAQLMSIKSSSYDGLPLSVGAWEDKRYVK